MTFFCRSCAKQKINSRGDPVCFREEALPYGWWGGCFTALWSIQAWWKKKWNTYFHTCIVCNMSLLYVPHHRFIRTVFMGKRVSLSPTRKSWWRWGLLFQTQWSWPPSTLHPRATWESEFSVSMSYLSQTIKTKIIAIWLRSPELLLNVLVSTVGFVRFSVWICLSHQMWSTWWIRGAGKPGQCRYEIHSHSVLYRHLCPCVGPACSGADDEPSTARRSLILAVSSGENTNTAQITLPFCIFLALSLTLSSTGDTTHKDHAGS